MTGVIAKRGKFDTEVDPQRRDCVKTRWGELCEDGGKGDGGTYLPRSAKGRWQTPKARKSKDRFSPMLSEGAWLC